MTTRSSAPAFLAAFLSCAALLLAGCGDDPAGNDPGRAPDAAKDLLPAGLFVDAAPAGAKPVGEWKKSAKEGDEVVLRGRIGGKSPFVQGFAVLTLADPALVPCSEMAMEDGCTTPWDYCCAPQNEITAGTATIQVAGADGRPLRHDLRLDGLEPLWWVVVKGKVGARPNADVLVVDATAIHVEKKVSFKPAK